jgi:hypothetical protein
MSDSQIEDLPLSEFAIPVVSGLERYDLKLWIGSGGVSAAYLPG